MVLRRVMIAGKVGLEWLVALVALVVLLPVLLLCALLVKLTSRGPIFYIDDRVGRHGETFRMVKFRSMYVGVEAKVTEDNKVIVEENDPRVTPMGGVLRMGFDELPQLLNVLRGEMALIGPRPDAPWMLPEYTDEIRPRLEMRPGITGLAQVLRGRDLSTEDNFRLDVHYVREWSPWMDVRIVLYTPLYVVGARNVGMSWLRRILPKAAESLDAPSS